ncbi:hypothetical protein [Amycolatopsis sp. lyj-90]|uniref:hypothetical protein n=1 Tax=Amycolatopsis sp. lyj-90 TaxID=2789285 RepID=UPI00397D2709
MIVPLDQALGVHPAGSAGIHDVVAVEFEKVDARELGITLAGLAIEAELGGIAPEPLVEIRVQLDEPRRTGSTAMWLWNSLNPVSSHSFLPTAGGPKITTNSTRVTVAGRARTPAPRTWPGAVICAVIRSSRAGLAMA